MVGWRVEPAGEAVREEAAVEGMEGEAGADMDGLGVWESVYCAKKDLCLLRGG